MIMIYSLTWAAMTLAGINIKKVARFENPRDGAGRRQCTSNR